MLYVIYGSDTQKVKKKANQLVNSLLQKRPDASLFKVGKENWNKDFFNETIPAVSLFSPKNIVVMEYLLEDEEMGESVFQNVTEMKNTEHICILIDGKLTKEEIKKLEKGAEKMEEHNKESVAKKEAPITFDLSAALMQKNYKKAFVIFQKLRGKELAAEEIHGVLWWQFKSLKIVLESKSAKEADMSPFVYSNCKAVEGKWEKKELDAYITKLVGMYHKAHRGEIDFMGDLERLCLG